MIITRKIEIYVCESDKELRRSYYDRLYQIRNIARDAANAATAHLFMLDNQIPYLDEQSKESLKYLGTTGKASTKQNVAYCLMSNLFKDKMDGICNMLANLSQTVRKNYQEDRKQGIWKRSLRSYKSTIPIPYQYSQFRNFRFAEYADADGVVHEGCFFEVAGIPFQMRFGKDRSNNRVMVKRMLEGDYKMCTSSIVCDERKTYLLMSLDIPQQEKKLVEGKQLYCYLDVQTPIVCTIDKEAFGTENEKKLTRIGTEEEFNHRRRQIQEALRRCQIQNKYTEGGRGRKHKCRSIEHWHEKEKNYVDTKLHTYSRMLVDIAVQNKCAEIVLVNQKQREKQAKEENKNGDNYVLRNWSYYSLKSKINYKAELAGIKVIEE